MNGEQSAVSDILENHQLGQRAYETLLLHEKWVARLASVKQGTLMLIIAAGSLCLNMADVS